MKPFKRPNKHGYWWVKIPHFGWSLFEVWHNCAGWMIRSADSMHGWPLRRCDWNQWVGPIKPPQ